MVKRSESHSDVRPPPQQPPSALPIGLVVKILLVLGILATLVLPVGLRIRETARRSEGVTNLKSVAIALYMYAGDDYWPPLSSKPGCLMFEMDTLYPKYITDPLLLLNPADPIRREVKGADLTPAFCFKNSSYFYIGYVVWNDEMVQAFAEAYRKRLEEGLAFDSYLPIDLPVGWPKGRLLRLDQARRGGYVRNSEVSPESMHGMSEIPALIERPNLYPGSFGGSGLFSKPIMGGTVLYQDGHTEFIRYPGKWPMTEKTIGILESLDDLE